MRLKPRGQRKLSADEVIQELRPKLARLPGVRVFLKNVPSIQIGGTSSKSQYQFTLQGQDTDDSCTVLPRISRRSCGICRSFWT